MNYKQIEFTETNNSVLIQSVKGHWKFMFVLHYAHWFAFNKNH